MILAMIYIPLLARYMGHAPLPLKYWAVLVCFGPVLYLLEWCRKIGLRRRASRQEWKSKNQDETLPVSPSHPPSRKLAVQPVTAGVKPESRPKEEDI